MSMPDTDCTPKILLVLNEPESYHWSPSLGATLGVFLLPIVKEKFGVPTVLGILSAVSLLGLVVTLILAREDTE